VIIWRYIRASDANNTMILDADRLLVCSQLIFLVCDRTLPTRFLLTVSNMQTNIWHDWSVATGLQFSQT